VLLDDPTLAAIVAGERTLVFRRWRRPSVRTGGTLRTRRGLLAIDEVRRVTAGEITEGDARAAGWDSRTALLAALDRRPDGDLYRVAVRHVGEDPRLALRARDRLDARERDALVQRLDRLDRASPVGPWTRAALGIIARRPAVRAGDLAAELGLERLRFKTNVRKLKELGLTESLEVGYRLSPRGEALAATLDPDPGLGPVGAVGRRRRSASSVGVVGRRGGAAPPPPAG
jgi:hypothetical protein